LPAVESDSDAIDYVVEQWRRERPDLDLSTMGVFSRLGRVWQLLAPAVEEVFTRHGLRTGEFDVLAALRRSGPPYTLTPSAIADQLMMSRAGMTNRLDRLESAGLVARRLDPADRRSFQIALTARGHEVVDAALTEHAANLARLVSPLGAEERARFDEMLRALLGGLEP
jgi:DNA-binding MarR family transcriptional regulator